jgi:elongation factor Ts
MGDISATMVKELRDKTGAGMMDCKKALSETGGDMNKAVQHLREQGIAKASKKAERETSEGIIFSYIHPGDKLGVLVEMNCETDFVARTDDFRNLSKDIAMQVAAADPRVVSREEIDQETLAQEREIFVKQAQKEGKPEKIIEKIVDGRMDKFYQEACLMEQQFIKDNDRTVTDVLTEAVAKLGENIKVRRFTRFRLGE